MAKKVKHLDHILTNTTDKIEQCGLSPDYLIVKCSFVQEIQIRKKQMIINRFLSDYLKSSQLICMKRLWAKLYFLGTRGIII